LLIGEFGLSIDRGMAPRPISNHQSKPQQSICSFAVLA
jgi:hypothetical protein